MCIVAQPQKNDQPARPDCAARRLNPQQRCQIALDALAGQSISELAQLHCVSRKFVYQQQQFARDALQQSFAAEAAEAAAQEPVLYYLPVTKSWLRQVVLGLILTCHSPYRGVLEFLTDHFDFSLSLGSVHNVIAAAVVRARQLNASEDLSAVKLGDHDEIFQTSQPVLVGVDAYSTYCYLLSLEEHRDADTWAVRLLELVERGFRPDAIIADFAKGLRAGQEQALPGVPCRGDVFHCLYEVGPLVRYLENRAYDAMETVEKLTRKQKQHQRRKGRKDQAVSQKLRHAKAAMARAIALADDVATLAGWLQRDILAVAGPAYQSRRELLDLVVSELCQREQQCEHRIGPVRRLLQNQGAELLSFAEQLDKDLAALAAECQVGAEVLREMLQTQQMSQKDSRRWQREAVLREQLRGRYHALSEAVKELASGVVRASSLVENLNSRLRSYFFLRRHLGPEYLELLRFYLNHRRFLRSEHAERVGKSPAELLTGAEHEHWLEMLGYQRFRRSA